MKHLFCLLFFVSLSAMAGNPDPLRDPSKLIKPVTGSIKETAIKLNGAKVVVADYDLIRRDFKDETKGMSNLQIDSWLIEHAAFMSEGQVQSGEFQQTNSKMDTSSESITAFRPKEYGRAMVFPTKTGLIDVKGAGAENPKRGDHSNGLASLNEALEEYAMEKVINKALDHSGGTLNTIGTYAVIDAGFITYDDRFNSDKKHIPYNAALILRQAHVRSDLPGTLLPTNQAFALEKTLRKYGITGTGLTHYDHSIDYDLMNIQGSNCGDLIDFGTFMAIDNFGDKPLREFYMIAKEFDNGYTDQSSGKDSGRALFGDKVGVVLLDSDSEGFQPKKELLLPNFWHGGNVSTWALENAEAFSKNLVTHKEIENSLKKKLKKVEASWSSAQKVTSNHCPNVTDVTIKQTSQGEVTDGNNFSTTDSSDMAK